MTYALDTNILIELLRGRDHVLSAKFLSHSPENYRVPEMVRAELLFGAQRSARSVENTSAVHRLLEPLLCLPFADKAVEHYAEIRAHLEKQGTTIGSNDLIIAATVRAHSLVLVTRNASEFSRVPALAVEFW